MKKLLLAAFVAALVAGTVEARRNCGRSCDTKCEQVCETKCEKRVNCMGKPRLVHQTCSNSCVEGEKPELCYLVPGPRNIVKHTDVQTTITYSCDDKPCCAVNPTAEQIEELRATGAIPSTCN